MAGRKGEPVDLTGEDDMSDDEALRYAIELSMQDQGNGPKKEVTSPEKPTEEAKGKGKEPEQPKGSFGSLVLDRKAMEEERLKRLAAKRPRDASNIDESSKFPPAKKQAMEGQGKEMAHSTMKAAQPKSPLEFPEGVVKKTWAYGYPRTGDDIKIEEVLRKDRLEIAVLSSYQWDDEWMLSKIDFPRTKLLLVAYAKDEPQV